MSVPVDVLCLLWLAIPFDHFHDARGPLLIADAQAGFAPKEATLEFVVALKQQNLDQLEKLFWDVSTPGSAEYQNYRTNDELLKIVAPPAAHRNFVKAWFNMQKATVVDRGDNLQVTATVDAIQNMFQTKLYIFRHHKQPVEILRHMGPLSVPARLLNYVDFIATIGDFPMIDVMPKISRPQQGQATVVPETLFYNYHVPSGQSAASVSQGVIEVGCVIPSRDTKPHSVCRLFFLFT